MRLHSTRPKPVTIPSGRDGKKAVARWRHCARMTIELGSPSALPNHPSAVLSDRVLALPRVVYDAG